MPSAHASAILGNLDLWEILLPFTEPSMSESKLSLPALRTKVAKRGGPSQFGKRTLQTV
jgi:hypothetical protein